MGADGSLTSLIVTVKQRRKAEIILDDIVHYPGPRPKGVSLLFRLVLALFVPVSKNRVYCREENFVIRFQEVNKLLVFVVTKLVPLGSLSNPHEAGAVRQVLCHFHTV